MKRFLGAHTVDKGGIDKAVFRAHNAGMEALQIFTTIPKFYGDKASIRPERVVNFKKALASTGIKPENVIAHAAYTLNLATPDAEKWERASAGLRKELERSTALGIGSVCFHPGAAVGCDRMSGLERVAKALTLALESIPYSTTRLLIENTAGAGQTVARSAEEIAAILSRVPDELRKRTGYGLDTCHLFASGYDISSSKGKLGEILTQFEREAGERPSFFHLNDSLGTLGSNVDRHALVGEGKIGVEPFRWLLCDRRTLGVPLILETPQQNYEIAADDLSPDPFDVKMMDLLRSFD